jgi:hypothetical protein
MSLTKDATGAEEGLPQPASTGRFLHWRRRNPQGYAALGLVAALLALLISLNLFQLTAPGPAQRVLRRAVASLTEIDSLLAVHEPALREQAEASPSAPLSLPDYPLDVSLSPQEVGQPPTEVRGLLLGRSAEQVYQEGSAAFREEGESAGSSGLSAPGAVHASLGFLTASNHDALRVATLVLAIVCGALSGALALLTRGYGRLTALGAAVAAASVLFLLLTAVVRLALGLATSVSDDYISVQLLDLAKGAAWLPLRNGLIFSGLGLALLVLGVVGHRLDQGTLRE